MNALAIDFGTKNIGLALGIKGIIQPLSVIRNDANTFSFIQKIITEYQIDQIFVGLSTGIIAEKTKEFIVALQKKIFLPIETVDETASTIESLEINSRRSIDAVSAAVILRRCLP